MYLLIVISIIEVLIIIISILIGIVFVTIINRKTITSMQKKPGLNIMGYYSLVQTFANTLKLLLKEYILSTYANINLFFIYNINK